eukprot:5061344-Prymnesium_polylepis.2
MCTKLTKDMLLSGFARSLRIISEGHESCGQRSLGWIPDHAATRKLANCSSRRRTRHNSTASNDHACCSTIQLSCVPIGAGWSFCNASCPSCNTRTEAGMHMCNRNVSRDITLAVASPQHIKVPTPIHSRRLLVTDRANFTRPRILGRVPQILGGETRVEKRPQTPSIGSCIVDPLAHVLEHVANVARALARATAAD